MLNLKYNNMKTKNFFFLIAILAFISCSEDSNTDEINNNNKLLKKSEIVDLNILSLDEQREYFKKLDYSKKLSIWNNKLERLISTSKNSKIESYLSELLNEINNRELSNGIDNEEFNRVWKQKLENLTSEYNWTDRDIYLTFTTLYSVEFTENLNKSDDQIRPVFVENNPNLGGSASEKCNCRWGGLGCLSNYCNKSDDCPADRDDELGCGFLWLQSCTGSCDDS